MNPYRHVIEFVEALRKEGFQTGVDTYLQVAAVCRSLPPDTKKAVLCDYLCPLFAADAASQQRFRERFPAYARLLFTPESENTLHDNHIGKKTEEVARPPRKRSYILYTLFAILVLGVALIIWQTHEVLTEAARSNPGRSGTAGIVGCMDSTAINYNPNATVGCDGFFPSFPVTVHLC